MGPLRGLRVIELAGQGPGPYCGMLLADLGCDVVTVDRPADAARVDLESTPTNLFMRGKRSIALDLKVAEVIQFTNNYYARLGAPWAPTEVGPRTMSTALARK